MPECVKIRPNFRGFATFLHLTTPVDPCEGLWAHIYLWTHEIHVLGHVGALISTFWIHFGSCGGSDGHQKITILDPQIHIQKLPKI